MEFWNYSRIYMAAASVFFWICVFTGWYAAHPTDQHWYNFDADVHSCVMFGSLFLMLEWLQYRKVKRIKKP